MDVSQSEMYKREARILECVAVMAATHFGSVENDRCCVDSEAPQSHL